jgi:hypothetical protein
MGVEWDVREFSIDDLPALYDLAVASYANDPNTGPFTDPYEHFEWLLGQGPSGPVRGFVAHVGAKIVGFYGAIPVALYYQNNKIQGTLSLFTMTHPDYRRQGMFTLLAKSLYQQLGEDDVQETHGFPNANSLPGFVRKLEWSHIATLDVRLRPLNPIAIIKSKVPLPLIPQFFGGVLSPFFRRISTPKTNGFRLQAVERFDSRADVLIEARAKIHGIIVNRDSQYLNWRYADSPYWQYHIIIAENDQDLLGYVVVRCLESFGLTGGMIMDIAALPGHADVLNALAQEAAHYSLQQGMDVAVCLVHGSNEILTALRKNRFMKVPRRLGLKKWYFGARRNSGQVETAILTNPAHWFITFGDDDVM